MCSVRWKLGRATTTKQIVVKTEQFFGKICNFHRAIGIRVKSPARIFYVYVYGNITVTRTRLLRALSMGARVTSCGPLP